MQGEIQGPYEKDGTPPTGAGAGDSEVEKPPLSLRKNAEEGLRREEQRLEVLRSMRDTGEIEADTDEMKIIAGATDSPEESEELTEREQRLRDAAEKRLEDHGGRQRKVQNVQDLIASLQPIRRRGRRSSGR